MAKGPRREWAQSENASDLAVSGVFWVISQADRRSHPPACAGDKSSISAEFVPYGLTCRCFLGFVRCVDPPACTGD
jgi:hypothetical protein